MGRKIVLAVDPSPVRCGRACRAAPLPTSPLQLAASPCSGVLKRQLRPLPGPRPRSLDALKWATKSLCNKDDEVRRGGRRCEGEAAALGRGWMLGRRPHPGARRCLAGTPRAPHARACTGSSAHTDPLPPPPPPSPAPPPQLHLISVLEAGGSLPNEVPGETASDAGAGGDCRPDPVALQKTQDLLQRCKGTAAEQGIKNVKAGGGGLGWAGLGLGWVWVGLTASLLWWLPGGSARAL